MGRGMLQRYFMIAIAAVLFALSATGIPASQAPAPVRIAGAM